MRLAEQQTHSLARTLSRGGKRLRDLREIPGFAAEENEVRAKNAMQLAILDARKRSGLKQGEIAALMGIPQSNVSRIEHQTDALTFKTFAAYLFTSTHCSLAGQFRRANPSTTPHLTRHLLHPHGRCYGATFHGVSRSYPLRSDPLKAAYFRASVLHHLDADGGKESIAVPHRRSIRRKASAADEQRGAAKLPRIVAGCFLQTATT